MSKIGHVTSRDTSWQTVASEVSLDGKEPTASGSLMPTWSMPSGDKFSSEGHKDVITKLSLPSTLPYVSSCLCVSLTFPSLWIHFIWWIGLKYVTQLSQNAILYTVCIHKICCTCCGQATSISFSDNKLGWSPKWFFLSSCSAVPFYHLNPTLQWYFSLTFTHIIEPFDGAVWKICGAMDEVSLGSLLG